MILRRKSTWFWGSTAIAAVVGVVGVLVDNSRLVGAALLVLVVLCAAASVFAQRAATVASTRQRRQHKNDIARSERLDERIAAVDRQIADIAAVLDRLVDDADDRLGRLEALTRRLAADASERGDEAAMVRRQIRRGVNSVVACLDDRMPTPVDVAVKAALTDSGITDQLRTLRHEPITEIDALLQLHRRFGGDDATPLVWGWAMSPRGVLQLVDLVTESGHRRILECGPGTSTVYLGRALQRVGGGRLTALEHSPEHAEQTRSLIGRLGLDDVVDIRLAELVDVEMDGETYQWYDPASIADTGDVDLLVVDGPPGRTGLLARFPALGIAQRCLASRAVVVLDDTNRTQEQAIVDRWAADERVTLGRSISPDQTVFEWCSDRLRTPLAEQPPGVLR